MQRHFNRKFDRTAAVLGALCFFLSALEFMIPRPLPFIRIGLANFPILLALEILPLPGILTVVFLKILGQGLIQGTLFSYTFLLSAAGSLCSAGIMILLNRLGEKRISLIGVSAAGALTSNIIQLFLAQLLLVGRAMYLIAPPFLAAGLVSSIILGALAETFCRKSLWISRHKGFFHEKA